MERSDTSNIDEVVRTCACVVLSTFKIHAPAPGHAPGRAAIMPAAARCAQRARSALRKLQLPVVGGPSQTVVLPAPSKPPRPRRHPGWLRPRARRTYASASAAYVRVRPARSRSICAASQGRACARCTCGRPRLRPVPSANWSPCVLACLHRRAGRGQCQWQC